VNGFPAVPSDLNSFFCLFSPWQNDKYLNFGHSNDKYLNFYSSTEWLILL
jgi:hypothetical protein